MFLGAIAAGDLHLFAFSYRGFHRLNSYTYMVKKEKATALEIIIMAYKCEVVYYFK